MARTKKYPGYIVRRGNVYRVRLCVGGRYYNYTVRSRDVRDAQQFCRKKYSELEHDFQRQKAGFPGPIRLSALLTKFEEEELPTRSLGCQRSYNDSLKPIRTYFVERRGDPLVDDVRAADIQDYLSWRRVRPLTNRVGKTTVSGRTLAKDRAVLHRVFAIAQKLEYRDGNPVAAIDPPTFDGRTPVILSDAQYEQLLLACDGRPMLSLYTLVLGETGARCKSEVMWLQWVDVDLEEGFLWIDSGRNGHRTKSGKGRWVPMTPRLRQAMKDHFAEYRFAQYQGQPSPWIFHHTISRRHHKTGERIVSLYDGFKAAAKRAKLPPALVQHDLRHRRVTTWLGVGKNPVHVKEAMGHSDLRTTMGYTHLVREHLRSLVEQEPKREELRDLA